MKGRRYATLDEIKTASKEELKKILKNDLLKCFEDWKNRWHNSNRWGSSEKERSPQQGSSTGRHPRRRLDLEVVDLSLMSEVAISFGAKLTCH
ncbi:hypothetical protein LAZ67_21002117 [Cordylochernes scorpioides]|uniref:Uncharacterized protein n=1 Tax=Cordylochernes scorpioides TaxID=51811 RepID=A0ABY6LPX8_9ARAC|nr:hypothetical protein LAZ67_21002117 [Cordylochernes scorpioides]